MLAVKLCVAVMVVGMAAAEDDAGKLAGTWAAQSNGAGSVWSFESKGDALQITNRDGQQTLAEITCKPDGRECKARDGGKNVTVSLWHNGAALVELETRGSEVTKRRFTVNAQDDGMDMETIAIVPPGKTETVHFTRLQQAAHNQQ